MITAEELISKLRSALQNDGDFPVSAKIIAELRQLTSDPKTTAEQVTEIILREPSLGTRVLHFVNSAFMRRSRPILTVSQAVIQIGMVPLTELCSGLVLLKKFVPNARRSGPFAQCLKRTVLVSLLSSSLKNSVGNKPAKKGLSDESGYLMGQFAELGTLLLGYYFPEILEAAQKRSEEKNQDLSLSIRDLTGLSTWKLSAEVIEALGLPKFFTEVLECSSPAEQGSVKEFKPEIKAAAKVLKSASDLGACITEGRSKIELDAKINLAKTELGINIESIKAVVSELPRLFSEHCSSVEMELQPLPQFITSYAENLENSDQEIPENSSEFEAYVQEIRQMVEDREPSASIITSIMETIAYGLRFDRVLLLLLGPTKQKLVGRMLLGSVSGFNPKQFERNINDSINNPDLKAFREGRPVFKGEPIFEGGWPIAALPIGRGSRAIGAIYADRIPEQGGLGEDLTQRETASLTILSDLLERAISYQARS